MKIFVLLCIVISFVFSENAYAQTSLNASGANGGSIIPGADSRACDNTIPGAIRFNSTNSCVEYCNGVSAWVCPKSCSNGGLTLGNVCWYAGASGQSCTTVCAARGGYNSATLSYAGSGGLTANCQSLMVAFSGAAAGVYGGDLNCGATGGGCVYRESDQTTYRCTPPVTTEAGAAAGYRRYCGCNN